ncbi:hypothetical protein A2363_00955 [Candidatus Gottesmanbacteria bacterium RIFOXYB1_FULL_47_11]|uniref:Uncharacterized protein n=1 Tax=Candidatus Gottesmanbacteria bacterium RIFOXYB1_FULL_47_11 TaxID=1798401 RepID=A0A1F6BGP5_9BACT|nr:MAG: hypothetical protein A2363_00955 [Candidatus Gottesmanbacteria bacterium RIFOXYB1_FULL_47_11]
MSEKLVEDLKKWYESIPSNQKRTDVPEFRTDSARGLTLEDISSSQASSMLIDLLMEGFDLSQNHMTVDLMHTEPVDNNPGRFWLELSGQPTMGERTGGQLVLKYTKEGVITDINVTPSFKMLGDLGSVDGNTGLFHYMLYRPRDLIVQDAMAMITLSKKALEVIE